MLSWEYSCVHIIDIVRPSDRIVTENVTVVQHSVHTDTHCRQSTLTGIAGRAHSQETTPCYTLRASRMRSRWCSAAFCKLHLQREQRTKLLELSAPRTPTRAPNHTCARGHALPRQNTPDDETPNSSPNRSPCKLPLGCLSIAPLLPTLERCSGRLAHVRLPHKSQRQHASEASVQLTHSGSRVAFRCDGLWRRYGDKAVQAIAEELYTACLTISMIAKVF